MCEKGVSCSFHVGGFASGLQCTSSSLPADISHSRILIWPSHFPVVAFTVPELVWEVSGENVCDPLPSDLQPVAAVQLPVCRFTISILAWWMKTGMD